MVKLLVVGMFGMLFGCAPDSNINNTFDREGKQLQVTVTFYDTRKQIEEAYRKANNLNSSVFVEEQWGFAQWVEWKDAEGNAVELSSGPYICNIHAFQPRRIDDQAVLTLGHELLHCVYGSYHK